MHELRVAQLESNEKLSTYRSRAGQRPMREQVLDILDELGVPNSPRVISEYATACFGLELPISRFASLRRDEERAFRKDPQSKPAWVVPALNMSGFAPIPRLVANSVWPLERRLIGPRTLRVNHLVTLLALLKRVASLGDEKDPIPATLGSGKTHLLLAIALRFARSVPGTWALGGDSDLGTIRAATEAELQSIAPDDETERKHAAEKLAKLPTERQIWGLPPVVKRDTQVTYKIFG
jgi:hypothetical protein